MMWKILTAQIRGEIDNYLRSCGLFPDEQKGCRKGSRISGELSFIDQQILHKSKTRWKNRTMACIDFKKEYDMVPESWMINCLNMKKIFEEVINFIEKTMKTVKVESTAEG